MRLGIVYHVPFLRDRRGCWCEATFGRYLTALAGRVAKLVVFAPTRHVDHARNRWRLDLPNVTVVELPFYCSFLTALPRLPRILSVLRRNARCADLVWLREGPFHYVFSIGLRPTPIFFEIVADVNQGVLDGTKYRMVPRPLLRTALGLHQALTRRMVQRLPTFVLSRELYARYRPVALWLRTAIASGLAGDDFLDRADTCSGSVVHLLFVGWLRHMKGLDTLINAVALLRRTRPGVELWIVGEGPEEPSLRRQVGDLGLDTAVRFVGYAFGDRLRDLYRTADIFVLPSVSEGTPRVLLEAMAAGLPLVATRIGGIPDMVTDGHNGLLVPAADPSALAAAIERLVADAGLRRRLIRAGYQYARHHTVADFVGGVLAEARSYYGLEQVPMPFRG